MTASLEIPFAIGERIWSVGNGEREEWVECPECAGTKALTLIRGNGQSVSLDCACCSVGYEPPRGEIKRTIYEHRPTPFVCGRVDVRGDEINYSESSPNSNCYSYRNAKDLFRDEALCAERCATLNAEHTAYQEQQFLNNLKSKRRNMAWSIHYWGRKVQDLDRILIAARARLAACKEKVARKEALK